MTGLVFRPFVAADSSGRGVPTGHRRERYELLKILGHGSGGIVHLGRDRSTGAYVAIKTFNPRPAEAATRLRFLVEQTRDIVHPHVLRTLDWIQRPDEAVLVMELAHDGSLQDLLDLNEELPAAFVERIARQLLEGVQELHRRGIIHRDIKPANILLTSDAAGHLTPKLADLGLAVSDDQPRLTQDPFSCVGTLGYVAPEVLAGHPHDVRADLWALGRTLALLADRADSPVAHALRIALSAMTDDDPARRPADAAAALRLLHAMPLVECETRALRTDERSRRAIIAHRRLRRRRGVGALGTAVAVAVALALLAPSTTRAVAEPRVPAPAPVTMRPPVGPDDRASESVDPCTAYREATTIYRQNFELRLARWLNGTPAKTAFQQDAEADLEPVITRLARYVELTNNPDLRTVLLKTGGGNRSLMISMFLLSLTAPADAQFTTTPVLQWLTLRGNALVQRDNPDAVGILAMVVLNLYAAASGCTADFPEPVGIPPEAITSLSQPRPSTIDQFFDRIDRLRDQVPR